ncbi:Bug family tripartite tricarboxylate transporter substrate binding protein [Bordetella petrii]|uniref:Bug family tripartite tricarboxylate transporter substrate binding protein n=1 Tax=Bordetella petrii TaxID=94624 RepID=UPI001E503A34|nr:tripartite tricarboxylate transporter substrate binding protein [Bordetella petrii]MCD0502010.1 tripartite tricarboxylate transporter substrate binding protein [Bordetella petrii]
MFTKPLMRGLCALLLTAFFAAPATASAAYPERPIRFVVAYPPGGTTDLMARRLAKELSAKLGQSIVVENKPGAGGNVGAAIVAKAAPDGYTLGVGTAGNLALNYVSYTNIPYDSRTDITPISVLAAVPNVIFVNGKSSIKSLRDLISHVKSDKDTFFGSTGVGNGPHLTGELFKARIGAESTHVPYQGAAPEITALLSGEVDYGFDNLTSVLPFIQSGKLTALAVTSASRAPSLPDVPTVQEQGLSDFDVTAWFALFGPASMDPAIVAKLESAIASLKSSKDFMDSLASMGADPQLSDGKALHDLIEMERARWPKLLQAAKVQLSK